MKNFSFLMHTNMKFGEGEFKNLPKYVCEIIKGKIVIVVDPVVRNKEIVQEVISELLTTNLDSIILVYSLDGEPTYEYLDSWANKLRYEREIKGFVAIGGGSVMDLAKGLAFLMTNEGPAISYRGFPTNVNNPLPVVCVPTTAGTGSETTYNAVFIDTNENKKLGINSIKNFPVLSILDPTLIIGAPKNVIASSGLDAVVHAIESFVSKKSSFISKMFSRESFSLLYDGLRKMKVDVTDIEAASLLQLGAYLAIIALANSSAGPAGGLSYLLGTWNKVPHGIAGAVFLPHVQKMNLEKGWDGLSELLPNKTAKQIIDILFELNDLFEIPGKLEFFGVKPKDYEKYVKACQSEIKGVFDVNPVEFTEEDIRKLLKKVF